MYFKEVAGSSESFSRLCHCWNELAVAYGLAVTCTRALNAMGTVHDDIWHNLLHVRDVSEIYHEIVIAETVAAFCEPNFLGTALQCFFYRIFHISTAQELCLLDVNDFTSLGCRNQKVGLSAEEGWNLENITNFACC